MARPTKLNQDTQTRFIAAIKLGLTYELAASYAGIDVRTFYAWMRRGQEEDDGIFSQFYHAVKQSEGHAAASCMARIVKAAEGGQWQSAAWIMERRFGYSARQEVRVGSADESMDEAEDLIARVAKVAQELNSELAQDIDED